MEAIAILGGTGPEGLGLAYRFARVGVPIVIGSRDAERARAAAERVAAAVAGARVRGLENAAALAAAARIVVAFPHEGVEPFLVTHAEALADKILIDVMVPLRFARGVCVSVPLAQDASLAEMIQRLAPRARVVSAFKNLSAAHLQRLEEPLAGDVLVCGDDAAAKRDVLALAGSVPKLRGVDAGPLTSARALEQLTVMLLNVNKLYGALTSVHIVGLP
jgi:8-hydroxy-5-deazaflavin:NADPH oxidoreductase